MNGVQKKRSGRLFRRIEGSSAREELGCVSDLPLRPLRLTNS
jgi:hypothetical protein